jgi:hypothetical protein
MSRHDVTHRPKATLRILRRPDLGEGVVRLEVDCRYGTTGITQVSADGCPQLAIESLATILAYRHEEECGRYDLADVHARGDRELYEFVERADAIRRAEALRAYVKGRRN